jgi:hypothetical protein
MGVRKGLKDSQGWRTEHLPNVRGLREASASIKHVTFLTAVAVAPWR